MDMSSDYETMREIEKALGDSKLKEKLMKNEVIDADEFIPESDGEQTDNNDMQSLYLTEPLINKIKGNTRNTHIYDHQGVMGENYTDDMNIRAKSENTNGQVHIDIRKRDTNQSYEYLSNTHDVNSEYLKQASKTLIKRSKKNRAAYKNALKTVYKK
jgi:hypothetical protein